MQVSSTPRQATSAFLQTLWRNTQVHRNRLSIGVSRPETRSMGHLTCNLASWTTTSLSLLLAVKLTTTRRHANSSQTFVCSISTEPVLLLALSLKRLQRKSKSWHIQTTTTIWGGSKVCLGFTMRGLEIKLSSRINESSLGLVLTTKTCRSASSETFDSK